MRPLGFVRVAPAADALSTAGDEGFANASLAAVCPRGESRGKRRPCNQDRGRSYSTGDGQLEVVPAFGVAPGFFNPFTAQLHPVGLLDGILFRLRRLLIL